MFGEQVLKKTTFNIKQTALLSISFGYSVYSILQAIFSIKLYVFFVGLIYRNLYRNQPPGVNHDNLASLFYTRRAPLFKRRTDAVAACRHTGASGLVHFDEEGERNLDYSIYDLQYPGELTKFVPILHFDSHTKNIR